MGPRGARPSRRLLAALSGAALVASVLVASSVPAAAACPAPGGAGVPEAPAPATGTFVFSGHGWGHGLGMSQYGAQGAGRLGCTATQILSTYYTGTSVATRTMPTQVDVRMLDGPSGTSATLQVEPDATRVVTVPWVLGATTVATQPESSTWRVQRSGTTLSLVDGNGVVRWTGPGTTPLRAVHSGSVITLRTFNGTTQVLSRRLKYDESRFSVDVGLVVRQTFLDNTLGPAMDKYLYGLAEVPVSWPASAQQAQAIAARTYAVKVARPLSPTPSDQAYGGYDPARDAPTSAWRQAVDATRARVVVDGAGALIDALYSSSMGGWTEDKVYVWGAPAVPYLRPVDDSVWVRASDDPRTSWAVAFTPAQVATALGLTTVTSVAVAPRGSTARTQGVLVTGTAGGAAVSRAFEGWDVRQALGLLSPGFTVITRPMGGPGAVPLVGDFDGDGRDDLAWWRAGRWSVQRADGSALSFGYGVATDRPVVGDWDGDGRDGIGVVRGSTWLLRQTASGGIATTSFGFGSSTDTVRVVGDWDGDGRDGIGVVRGNTWLLRETATGGIATRTAGFGSSSDRLHVTGDWDGVGPDGIGVVRQATWFLRQTATDGVADRTVVFLGG